MLDSIPESASPGVGYLGLDYGLHQIRIITLLLSEDPACRIRANPSSGNHQGRPCAMGFGQGGRLEQFLITDLAVHLHRMQDSDHPAATFRTYQFILGDSLDLPLSGIITGQAFE